MATAVSTLRCKQGILSSRVDHKCDRIADFVVLTADSELARCADHLIQVLSVLSVGVVVMNAATYAKFSKQERPN